MWPTAPNRRRYAEGVLVKSRLFPLLFLVIAVLAVSAPIIPTIAQSSDPNPLLSLLAFAPDDAESRTEVSYTDYRALVEARPGAAQPKNYIEWLASRSQQTPEAGRLMAALQGISSGSREILQGFVRPAEMVEAVGIDPFTVNRVLVFGAPPRNAVLLDGKFDPSQIGAKLANKGFQKSELSGYTLWCSPEGCDDGMRLNPRERDPMNPFGGHLGRKQPIAVSADKVFSSADDAVVENMVKAVTGETKSLAVNKNFTAIVEAFAEKGVLLQAHLLDPEFTWFAFAGAVTGRQAQALEAMKAEFVPIPAYSLVGLAHIADGQHQLALAAVVYDSEADAKAAQEVISARIPKYISLVTGIPLVESVADRGGVIDPLYIHASQSNSKYVLVVTLRGSIEPQEPNQDGRYITSGMLFRYLFDALARRDLGWLAVEAG